MSCFTVEQRNLCNDGLVAGFVGTTDFFQMLIKLSAHPKLAAYPNAPITRRLRKPSIMFGANAAPEEMVFDLIEEIEATSLCLELVEVAHQWNPFNPQLKKLYLEMEPPTLASPEIKQALEKAILIKPEEFINPSEWFERLAPIEFRVCRIEAHGPHGRQPLGTGFLVGPDLVLTNYHVVREVHLREDDLSPDIVVAAFDRKLRPDGRENLSGPEFKLFNPAVDEDWLLAFSPPAEEDGKANPIGEPERLDALDYALLRLESKAAEQPIVGRVGEGSPAKRGFFALNSARTTRLQGGESLIIFQHPQSRGEMDPEYAPMVLDMGTVAASNQSRLTYNTSTLSGSSGSPCFDREFRLCALHHALILSEKLNEGIPIGAIVNDLRQKGFKNLLEAHV